MSESTSPSESPEQRDERYDRQTFRILRNTDLNLLTIFEAVYTHKGIVNVAKILNITPSATSRSTNKLRVLFSGLLPTRKGQGVMSTAYAIHLHQYISWGMEVLLSASDIVGSPHRQRVITIATTPGMGALLIPIVASAPKSVFPQVLLHNIIVTDVARQLDQRQVDLLVDAHLHSDQAMGHHMLYQDRVQVYYHAEHPALRDPQDEVHLARYKPTLLFPEGQRYPIFRRRLQGEMGERRCGFSTFNLLTRATVIAESDMLGLIIRRLFAIVSRLWSLQTLDFHSLQDEKINVALHYSKQSGREPLLKEVIETVIQAFKT